MSKSAHRVELAHRADALVSITPPALVIDRLSIEERNRAFDKGYREGFDQAAQSLKQEMRNERMQWEQQLQVIISQLQDQENQLAGQIEQALGELILSGIQRVLKSYEPNADQLKEIVDDALRSYPREEANLKILLNPSDCELIGDFADSWISQYPGIQFKADKGLRRGDCLVQGRYGTTDARLSTKLNNLREGLSQ